MKPSHPLAYDLGLLITLIGAFIGVVSYRRWQAVAITSFSKHKIQRLSIGLFGIYRCLFLRRIIRLVNQAIGKKMIPKYQKAKEQYVAAQINSHAQKWARILKKTTDDLKQELTLHIVAQEKNYDSMEARFNAFVDRILENKIGNIIKEENAKTLIRNKYRASLDVLDDLLAGGSCTPRAIRYLVDLKLISTKLPSHLSALLNQLRTYSVSEISDRTGISRNTLYDRIEKLCTILRNEEWI